MNSLQQQIYVDVPLNAREAAQLELVMDQYGVSTPEAIRLCLKFEADRLRIMADLRDLAYLDAHVDDGSSHDQSLPFEDDGR